MPLWSGRSMSGNVLSEAIFLEQSQPELAARREARHGVPEAFERDLADDRDRRSVDELADVGSGERGSRDYAAVLVDHDARSARRVAPVERAACVGAASDLDDPDVEPGLARAGLGVTDGGDLRVGEDDARRLCAVGAQLDRLARDVVGC